MSDSEDSAVAINPGAAAVALFGILEGVILGASGAFPTPAGFPADAAIVTNIGYALFDINIRSIPTEGFLAAFLIIAIALDVALDSAVYLAKREDNGTIISALTGGGNEVIEGEVAGTVDDETEAGLDHGGDD